MSEHTPHHSLETNENEDDSQQSSTNREEHAALPENCIARLKKHKAVLETTLECQYGLLIELSSRGVLSDEQMNDIDKNSTVLKQNEKFISLINVILYTKRKELIEAMTVTKQTHLVQFLISDDYCSDTCRNDRPLTVDERENIRQLSSYLVRHIDLQDSGLLTELSAECLTFYHIDSLKRTGQPQFEVIKELLDIIKRRSFQDYKEFLNCLCRSGQNHIVHDVINHGGEYCNDPWDATKLTTYDYTSQDSLVKHSKVNNTNKKIYSCFETVAAALTTLEATIDHAVLQHLTLDQVQQFITLAFEHLQTDVNRIQAINNQLNIYSLDIIGIRKGCIRVYFLCSSLEALLELRRQRESGELTEVFEIIFRKLLSDQCNATETISIQRLWMIEYWKCKNILARDLSDTSSFNFDEKTKYLQSTSGITQLPKHLQEDIVLKSFTLISGILNTLNATSCPQKVFEQLAVVCRAWRKMFQRGHFSKKLRLILAEREQTLVNKLTSLDTGSDEAVSVTQLRDRIYVASFKSNSPILVYDMTSFAQLPDLMLKVKDVERINIRDIAACSRNNCLYISDYLNNCIWRLTEEERKVERWLDMPVSKTLTASVLQISVTVPGHVLCLSEDPPTIKIYNGTDASLCHDIKLGMEMNGLQHAIEMPTSTYIVCQAESRRDGDLHRLCEFDNKGQMIRAYGLRGYGNGLLYWPLHVAVDNISGRVYIADCDNNCVTILDRTLSFCGVIPLDLSDGKDDEWKHGEEWNGGKEALDDRCKDIARRLRFKIDAESYPSSVESIRDVKVKMTSVRDSGRLLEDPAPRSFPWRISYCVQSGRLVVGLRDGHVGIYSITPFVKY